MSIGPWQIILIIAIILIFFGPSRIPGLGKSIGQAIKGFKKGLDDDEIDVTDSAKKEELSQTQAKTSAQKSKEKEKSTT